MVYCSHVLEHVPNDLQAMREFFRVLRKGGWAIFMVPISGEKTFEDPSIVDPKERLKAFGQADHVRFYGLDFVDRLLGVGFNVDIYEISDLDEKNDFLKMGLQLASDKIFYCTK